MLTDLLFLRRFYADPAPWRNLRAIHESVLRDFAPAGSSATSCIFAGAELL